MPKGYPNQNVRLLTAEIKAQILKEAQEPGCNRSALAEKWNVSRAFIYLLLNPASFAPPKPTDLIGAHEIQKLRKTLRLSLRQFADLLGVDEATIRGWEDEQNGWQPRAASRHRLLQIATEHGLPLEFLASSMSVKTAGIEVKNPIDYLQRRQLKREAQKAARQDFRRRILEPPPPEPVPQAPPPKTVTVGNRTAFDSAKGLFGQ